MTMRMELSYKLNISDRTLWKIVCEHVVLKAERHCWRELLRKWEVGERASGERAQFGISMDRNSCSLTSSVNTSKGSTGTVDSHGTIYDRIVQSYGTCNKCDPMPRDRTLTKLLAASIEEEWKELLVDPLRIYYERTLINNYKTTQHAIVIGRTGIKFVFLRSPQGRLVLSTAYFRQRCCPPKQESSWFLGTAANLVENYAHLENGKLFHPLPGDVRYRQSYAKVVDNNISFEEKDGWGFVKMNNHCREPFVGVPRQPWQPLQLFGVEVALKKRQPK
jgi:hypothetical protein